LGQSARPQAFLHDCAGRYEDALAAAEQAVDYPVTLLYAHWGLIELIEAAARSGRRNAAASALARLSETTQASGSNWALGIEARSRALAADDDDTERLYREAIDRLGRTRIRVELARTHLLYGEWLRRQHRRSHAREQLRTAHEMVTKMGIDALAERITRELLATGGHARKRTVETRDGLTPQEAQISRHAAEGATNQEIAGQLFISPSTVDYHLRKAFRRLGVKSRHQLDQHLHQQRTRLESGTEP
jgi:DNA-binding CsgD family transcriptional regulator